MVNPVGSYENKYWQKKWAYTKSLPIDSLQYSLIIGSLLGDGTMRVGKGAANANFKVEQGLQQKEFTFWKYEILNSLVLTEPKVSMRYDENRLPYEKSWWFRTVRHPFLTEIYNRFYVTDGYRAGKKIVPLDIQKDLNSFALAVWIMDDGSYSDGKIDISTYAFSIEEIILLQKVIQDNFDCTAKYYKDRDKGYRMYWNKTESAKIIKAIYPHIIPSMMYKIGIHNLVTTGSDAAMKDAPRGEDD